MDSLGRADIDFKLETGGGLTGSVTDVTGAGIEGLWVQAFSNQCDSTPLPAGAETDAAGNFTIYGLPAGEVYVKACASCRDLLFIDEWSNGINGTGDCNNATPVSVVTGELSDSISFRLKAKPIFISNPPGIDVFYDRYGVIAWSTPTDAGDPHTGLVLEAKIIDYDGIAPDGSSHTVEVEYPNGIIKTLEFQYRNSDGISAVYELYDGNSSVAENPDWYTGDYIFRVTDPEGDWSEAIDNLSVNLVNPPAEEDFSLILNPKQTIEVTFERACGYNSDGELDGCDEFIGGLAPGVWQDLPRWAWWESDTVRMAHIDSLGRAATWLQLLEPEIDGSFSDLETRVRIDGDPSDEPVARIGGTYFRDAQGDIFATVGIRKQEAFFTIVRLRWEGNHLITQDIIRDEPLGSVTQGNRYDVRLKWDGTDTFTFTVKGVEAGETGINYSQSYQVLGKTGGPADPWQGIGIATWHWIDTTTPEFNWSPVEGATYYRVRIYGLNNNTIYRGYTQSPPFRLPPGVLKADAAYKYRIEAIRDHQWFEWDNVARSDRDLTVFVAGPDEAEAPAIDVYSIGVETWNDLPPLGAYTLFYVRIHDAQGVPGDIQSARVILPDGLEAVNLYLEDQITATQGLYRGVYFGATPAGEYTFEVIDRSGNPGSATETLVPDPIGFPDTINLSPIEGTLVGGTGLDFNWDDVTDAAFYQLNIYDESFSRIYNIKTIASEFKFPAGLLEENRLYRYRIYTRREFYEDNADNTSSSPPYGKWNANTFLTTESQGDNAPILDLSNFGVAVWQGPNPNGGAPLYYLEFLINVTDLDGVPQNIERVEVIYPDGIKKMVLKNFGGTAYYGTEAYYDSALIQDDRVEDGIYTFKVVDFDGNIDEVTDTLEDAANNPIAWPQNVTPVEGTEFFTNTPTITWGSVPGAAYYKVRITTPWTGSTIHWSGELTDTQYTVPDGVLEEGTSYGFRIYAYREGIGSETDYYAANSLRHIANPHFKIERSEDSDDDGLPDGWEDQHGIDDPVGDPDNDGLTNLQEYQNTTNPNNPDTDGDWVKDGDEVGNGTNPNDPADFTSPGTGAIRGSVRDADGTPISDAQIRLQVVTGDPCGGWQQIDDFITTDGTYIIVGLDPLQDYWVRTDNMWQSNYVNEWYASPSSSIACSGAHLVNVPEDGSADGIDFLLDMGAEISGTVYRADGSTAITDTPINISAIRAGDPCQGHTNTWSIGTQTDVSDGSFNLRGVPVGTASVYLNTGNMNQSNYLNEWWRNIAIGSTPDCSQAELLDVPGGGVTGLSFQLDLGGSVSGRVTYYPQGDPIPNLRVHANDERCGNGQWAGSDETDETGYFKMWGIPANSDVYVQTCAHCQGQNWVDRWWHDDDPNGVSDCNEAAPVSIASGVDSGGIDFALYAGGTISGVVTNDAGDPITGTVSIELWEYHTGEGRGGYQTEPGGAYSITGLASGDYRLMANASGTEYAGEYYDSVFSWNTATAVSIDDGEVRPDINFSLGQGTSISGIVENEAGNAISGAWVYVHSYDDGTWFGGTNSDTDGLYNISGLPPGDYRVEVEPWGTPYAREIYDNTYSYNEAARVTTSTATPATDIDFNLVLSGSISGTVTNQNSGEPLANMRVVAHMFDDGWGGDTRTDSNGDYTIDGLPPVGYRVEFDPEGANFLREYYDDSTDWSSAKRIVVAPGGDTPGIDFEVTSGFPIEGSVRYRRKPEQNTGILVEETLIEVYIQSFEGALPNDIETVTVTDPDGVVVATFPDNPGFEWNPDKSEFAITLPGRPKLGVYTFTVTSGDATATDTDYQYILREFPILDKTALSPAEGAAIDSKTPTFTWSLIEYPDEDIPIFYRLEIAQNNAGEPGDQVFASDRLHNATYFTIPPGSLLAGQNYFWRVRVSDSDDWIKVQNRVDSAWLPLTMAASLSAHAYQPAIGLDGFGAASWSWDEGRTGFVGWIKVIDHEGVSSDGLSHTATVQYPDGREGSLYFVRPASATAGYYEYWSSDLPPSGNYTFKAIDPDGNESVAVVESLDADPLPLPDQESFVPNVKEEYIIASFDNVLVNDALYDNFDSYAGIEDLDFGKWYSYHENVSVGDGKLVANVSGSIGRGNGNLNFVNPSSINSIQADITIDSISDLDGIPYAQLKGIWYNDGKTEIAGSITVKGSRVYYGVYDDGKLSSQRTYSWDADELAGGDLLTGINPGQTITARIALAGSVLSFSVNGQPSVDYTIQGDMFTPISGYKQLRTRINLTTDTTPTFTLDPVADASRYRVRIYNYDSSNTIVNGWTGTEPTYTFPPGILKPNSYYRYRMETRDEPSPLNIDNVSKAPPSNNDNYIFYTGSEEAVDPFIDLVGEGVRTLNEPVEGSFLGFWITVHDAQGVPDNIKTVKVINPSGAETDLNSWCSNPFVPSTSTSCVYVKDSDQPIESGTYTFIAEDKDGNTSSITEDLTPDVIGFPAVSSLVPADKTLLNSTAINFNWDDVPGASFYKLNILDYNLNLIYSFSAILGVVCIGCYLAWNLDFSKIRRSCQSENR